MPPSLSQVAQWRQLPFLTLVGLAQAAKLRHRGQAVALCSIVNAKSGACSEDCAFCVQSAHFHDCRPPVYPLKSHDELVAAARQARADGAQHFSIVTSGRGLPKAEVLRVAAAVTAIRSEVGITPCASLGILDAGDLARLRDAGLVRYHHNLEAAPSFFPRICSTHTFAERVATIEAAQQVGLEVCSGGIFGLGEGEEERIELALFLAGLGVQSVPLNVLIPLPGTPLADQPPPAVLELLRAIALYRLIMPALPIRLAAGRETVLADFLGLALLAGADGMMIGGYLTQRGRPPALDLALVREMHQLWSA
ncbi:MAG: biotin synthase BioB [Thermodesulfobacteriota bacterium]